MVGRAPKSIAVSKDGHYVYSADYGERRSVSVVDTRDWTARIKRKMRGWQFLPRHDDPGDGA